MAKKVRFDITFYSVEEKAKSELGDMKVGLNMKPMKILIDTLYNAKNIDELARGGMETIVKKVRTIVDEGRTDNLGVEMDIIGYTVCLMIQRGCSKKQCIDNFKNRDTIVKIAMVDFGDQLRAKAEVYPNADIYDDKGDVAMAELISELFFDYMSRNVSNPHTLH